MLGVARLGAQRLELGEERPVLALELCYFVRQRRVVAEHDAEVRVRFLQREVELPVDAQLREQLARIRGRTSRLQVLREVAHSTQRRVESHSLRTRLRPWPYERRLLLNHATRYASFEPPCAAKARRWFSESSGQRGANSAARCRMPRGSR